jgi:hypothetical protein
LIGYSIGTESASAPEVVARQARAALELVADGHVRIDVAEASHSVMHERRTAVSKDAQPPGSSSSP